MGVVEIQRESCLLQKDCIEVKRGFEDDPEVWVSATGKMEMALTEYRLNYIPLCIIDHIVKSYSVFNNKFQLSFFSCRLKIPWPLTPGSSFSNPFLLSPSPQVQG